MAVKDFLKRAIEASRYTVSGIRPDTWMSPLNPLPPFQPITEPRQFDYNVGYNLFYIPRGTQRYTFNQLRNASKNSQLIRLAIETRLDQMDALNWKIQHRNEDAEDEKDKRIVEIQKFFDKPDGIHDWAGWLRMLLEEMLVTDALSIIRQPNRGGGLHSLEIIDGSTIFPIIDNNGRQPIPPDPAYQQILKGVPKADYTADQLIYAVRKVQVNTPYGMSPVEQVIETAYTDIERAKYQLSYFTEGSVPDSYITAPESMTPDRVKAYELELNELLSGNAAGRRRMPVMLYGMEVHQLKEPPLMNEFDEWIWRKVALAFSLPPTSMVKQNNRATASSEKDRATEEGLHPLMRHVKRLLDRIITEDFNAPDLEFHWEEEEEQDPKEAADIDSELVKAGIITLNEARDKRGLDAIEGGDIAMCYTAGGYVPVDPEAALELKMKSQPQVEDTGTKAGNNPPKPQPKSEKAVKKKPIAPTIYDKPIHKESLH